MNPSPPLNALRIFLVACRHRSFTSAAEELSLTHGAVSRQMKILEEWLGQPLFEREGLRRAPTPYALSYAEEISRAFSQIQQASLHYGRGMATRQLRVSVPATLAMKWLIPQLPDFRARYPDARIQVQTVTTQQQSLAGAFDLAIRRDLPQSQAFTGIALFKEWHTLIVSPAVLNAQPLNRLEDVLEHTWLYSDTRPRYWDAWLEAANLPNRPWNTYRFDHYYVTYNAVLDGLGVGIGPMPTLAGDLARGRIVAPFPEIRTPQRQYWAITPTATQKTLLHQQFEQWLSEISVSMGSIL